MIRHEAKCINSEAMLAEDLLNEPDHEQVVSIFHKQRLPACSPLGNVEHQSGNIQFPSGPEITLELAISYEFSWIHAYINYSFLLKAQVSKGEARVRHITHLGLKGIWVKKGENKETVVRNYLKMLWAQMGKKAS